MKEIYKDIKGYERLHQVSNLGNIKGLVTNSHRRKGIKKPWVDKDWYLYITLFHEWHRKNHRIHRLVAQAFLWNIKWKIVMHLDDDPKNNKVDNLRIGTQKENIQDCVNKWRMKDNSENLVHNKWEKHFNSKLTDLKVKSIKILLKDWYRWVDIADIYWISKYTISLIKLWKTWKHIII